jgi:hypothetical protein
MSEPSNPTNPTPEERELIEQTLSKVMPGFELLEAESITSNVSNGDSFAPDEQSGVFVSPDIVSISEHYAQLFPDIDQSAPSREELPWETAANSNPLPDRDGWFCRVRKTGPDVKDPPILAILLSLSIGLIGIQTGA